MKIIESTLKKLKKKQYIKLIAGASFTDTDSLKKLIAAYLNTGICCIDVACDPEVIETTWYSIQAQQLEDEIALMVSFPLDEDPHFRKIQVNQDCIHCGLCEPTCPTTVFSLPESKLITEAEKCYGCGRCLPVCPTDALYLEPFSVMQNLKSALSHPGVSAVEIHSKFADPIMVEPLFTELGPLLKNKLLSICLQPQNHPQQQVAEFLTAFSKHSIYPLIIQVDGNPMSATADPKASLPAIQAAEQFYQHTVLSFEHYTTLSGGINQHTAQLIRGNNAINGVGIGSAAKLAVWEDLESIEIAQQKANQLITPFLLTEEHLALASSNSV